VLHAGIVRIHPRRAATGRSCVCLRRVQTVTDTSSFYDVKECRAIAWEQVLSRRGRPSRFGRSVAEHGATGLHRDECAARRYYIVVIDAGIAM
jgi:hypothetical protein